ncbi:hypothetical protein TNCV_2049001 [Trichonephila clavipes]|nr:hypothetical protein TNCV_2049001 [Trichonephila clavipes]
MAIFSNQLEKRSVNSQIRNLINSRSLAYVGVAMGSEYTRSMFCQCLSERKSRVQDLNYPYLCDQVKGGYHSTRTKATSVRITRIAVFPDIAVKLLNQVIKNCVVTEVRNSR